MSHAQLRILQRCAGEKRSVGSDKTVGCLARITQHDAFVPAFVADALLAFEGVERLHGKLDVGKVDGHFAADGVLGVVHAHAEAVRFAGVGFVVRQVGTELRVEYVLRVVESALLVVVGLYVDAAPESAGGVRRAILIVSPVETEGVDSINRTLVVLTAPGEVVDGHSAGVLVAFAVVGGS